MTREEVLDEVNVIYERLSHPEDCENGCYSFSDGNYTEALEVLIDYYEVGIIEELEKIKEDIQKYVTENKNSEDLYLSGCGDGAYHTLATINKKIAELKGE